MLFRSTGLGKTELVGRIAEMQRQGDYLIMHVDVVEPVKWRIRAALSFRDLVKVIGACAKAAIISFVLSPKQWRNKEPLHPGEF
ncbi:unnamed protein product [marine sediment metagenome]|uniref:Uncharacterized protein n=1 Tax=marine sediment metagenome TaxID=412755 RepID=X1QQ54_9ZZZZ